MYANPNKWSLITKMPMLEGECPEVGTSIVKGESEASKLRRTLPFFPACISLGANQTAPPTSPQLCPTQGSLQDCEARGGKEDP